MWRRCLLDLGVTFAVAIAAVLVGHHVGPDLGIWLVHETGLEKIVVRAPSDFEFSGLGAAFVLPAVFAGLAGVLFRLRRKTAPSPLYLIAVGVIIAGAIAAWLALRIHWFASVTDDYATTGIAPMISLDSFELPSAAWQAGVVAGVLICGVPWFASRRR